MNSQDKEVQWKIGKFSFIIPTNMKFEIYNEPENFYGIVFYHKDRKYDVFESKLGTRLIINGKEGEIKDLPFHKGTFEFLPSYIKIS